jgi:hypothetical protein
MAHDLKLWPWFEAASDWDCNQKCWQHTFGFQFQLCDERMIWHWTSQPLNLLAEATTPNYYSLQGRSHQSYNMDFMA